MQVRSHHHAFPIISRTYANKNAVTLRISAEVRRALRFPADKLREGLQRSVESLEQQRTEKVHVQTESAVARKFFGNLVREASDVKGRVERVDLEGPAPGVAAAYDG